MRHDEECGDDPVRSTPMSTPTLIGVHCIVYNVPLSWKWSVPLYGEYHTTAVPRTLFTKVSMPGVVYSDSGVDFITQSCVAIHLLTTQTMTSHDRSKLMTHHHRHRRRTLVHFNKWSIIQVFVVIIGSNVLCNGDRCSY